MKNRSLLILLLISTLYLSFMVSPQTNATVLPVMDAANLAQNQLSFMDQIRNTINSFTMLQNQMTQIAYAAQNLIKMDGNMSQANMLNIQRNLSTMMTLSQNVIGIALNYENQQYAWDATYPNFDKYNGMSGADYAKQSEITRNQTNNAVYDAMMAQGLVAQLGNDTANLNLLLYASANAEGVLAAIQAGNQIAALQVQQLMRLQQIMATSYRAEASFYAEEAQGKAAATANANKLKLSSKNTLKTEGNGDGTPGF